MSAARAAGCPRRVIAGAGSGKTNTLAHRVANLIVNGVDPRRILLMTFSRRAASEMSRRVESICAKVLGAKADIMTDALTWAGTFHAIGARLLREYAEKIGLHAGRTVTVTVKHADFQQITRRRSFLEPVASQRELERISLELLRPCFPPPRGARLLGVTLSSLITAKGQSRPQLALGLDLSAANPDQVQYRT